MTYARGLIAFRCLIALAALAVCLTSRPAPAGDEPTPPAAAPGAGEAEQIGKDFEEIFARPEFRRLRIEKSKPTEAEMPEWLRKFFDWLGDLFTFKGGNYSGLGGLLQALAYGVLAVVCCLIIWLVVRAVQNYRERNRIGSRRRRTYEEGEGEIPPGDLPADEYLRRAAELAQQGHFREAIGQLILGAMSRAERSGLIRFRRGLTNRDYLRALRGQTRQHQAFRTIVGVYEPICFGRRDAQVEHYRTSLDEYQTGFRDQLTNGSGATPGSNPPRTAFLNTAK